MKTAEDIQALEENRKKKTAQAPAQRSGTPNRFRNFEQRDTDYDALAMELWQKEK